MSKTVKSILAMAIVALLPFAATAYDFEINGIYYNIVSSSDKTAELTYKDANYASYSGDVTIPSTVTYSGTTYTVISIGDETFFSCKDLKGVTIPSTVTSIGGGAFFGCSGLASVNIPNSVTSIGGGAFDGCSGLTYVTIPNSVTSIGMGAFQDFSGLTSITIPNSVPFIDSYTFSSCSGLASITIPNSVIEVGKFAFNQGLSLCYVEIGENVSKIDSSVFRDCPISSAVINCRIIPDYFLTKKQILKVWYWEIL